MQTNLISKIFLCIVCFVFFACKSNNDSFSNLLDKHKNFDKYQDVFSGYVYTNENLDFSIEFDSKWKIITSSKDFTEMQKKYADYVSTERSELLFIGQNETNGLCVRCLAEVLGMKLDDYVKSVKNDNADKNKKYKISFIEEKKIEFETFEAFHNVYEIELNGLNKFVFDAILFKNFNNNYRLEFWCTKANYEKNKEIILNIMKNIKFEQDEKIESDSDEEAKSE